MATRAERRRAGRQLAELASARSEISDRTEEEWMVLFRAHRGSEGACPNGHPEIALGLFTIGRDALDEDYVCPACFEKPVGSFSDVEQNVDPNLPGYTEV